MNSAVTIRLCIFGIASLGATLLLGCIRRFPLGFVGTLAAGAYTGALLRTGTSLPWAVCILGGMLAGGIVGMVPALFKDALVGDEYALLSWMFAAALCEIIPLVELLGGTHSLTGIPPLFVGPSGVTYTAILLSGITGFCLVAVSLFRQSVAFQQARLVALNPGQLAASGQSAIRVSLQLHLIAGSLGGLAGALWGPAYQVLDPSVFGLPETIVILLICLIGGEGEPLGIPIGIAIVFLLPKALPLSVAAGELRKLSVMLGANPPDSSAVVSSLQQATLGVLLVVFITLLRRGVIPSLRASLHAGSPSK